MSEFTDEQITELHKLGWIAQETTYFGAPVDAEQWKFYCDSEDVDLVASERAFARAVAEHVATAKDARIAELASEITNAYDAILLAVPQADDENGKRLTVAAKIELLAAENLRQQERIATLTVACEAVLAVLFPIHAAGNMSLTVACIQLRKALEDSK